MQTIGVLVSVGIKFPFEQVLWRLEVGDGSYPLLQVYLTDVECFIWASVVDGRASATVSTSHPESCCVSFFEAWVWYLPATSSSAVHCSLDVLLFLFYVVSFFIAINYSWILKQQTFKIYFKKLLIAVSVCILCNNFFTRPKE